MDLQKEIMRAEAYKIAGLLLRKYIKLNNPVIFKVSKSRKFAKEGSAEYQLFTYANDTIAGCFHQITLAYAHNEGLELTDTICHELLHCWQEEADKRTPNGMLPHDAAFWRKHNRIMVKLGLPVASAQHIIDCQKND